MMISRILSLPGIFSVEFRVRSLFLKSSALIGWIGSLDGRQTIAAMLTCWRLRCCEFELQSLCKFLSALVLHPVNSELICPRQSISHSSGFGFKLSFSTIRYFHIFSPSWMYNVHLLFLNNNMSHSIACNRTL